jgi:hypothetical protein
LHDSSVHSLPGSRLRRSQPRQCPARTRRERADRSPPHLARPWHRLTPQASNPALGRDHIARQLASARRPRGAGTARLAGTDRLAYSWLDGTPRVVAIWFHWTGEALTFGSPPPKAPKVRALRREPRVTVTIHAPGGWPYHALLVRGDAAVDMLEDVSDEYAAAARRYFGDDQGKAWVEQLSGQPMVRFHLRLGGVTSLVVLEGWGPARTCGSSGQG